MNDARFVTLGLLANELGLPVSIVIENVSACPSTNGLTKHLARTASGGYTEGFWLSDAAHAALIEELQAISRPDPTTPQRSATLSFRASPTPQTKTAPAMAAAQPRIETMASLQISDRALAAAEAFGLRVEETAFLAQFKTICANGDLIRHDGVRWSRARFDIERAAWLKAFGVVGV